MKTNPGKTPGDSTDSPGVGAHLHRGEGVVLQEGEADDRHQQELDAEGVVLRVVAVPEAHVDQVDGGVGHGQEHHLSDVTGLIRYRHKILESFYNDFK